MIEDGPHILPFKVVSDERDAEERGKRGMGTREKRSEEGKKGNKRKKTEDREEQGRIHGTRCA